MKPLGALVVVTSVSALLSLAAPASAQQGGPCAEDMQKFCKDVKPGGGAKMKCLHEHQAELSDACKKHLDEAQHAQGPCRADVEKFCKDVKPGGGRIQDCLYQHQADLSPGCKEHHSKPQHHSVP
jgi:cysteine rich repeat protein